MNSRDIREYCEVRESPIGSHSEELIAAQRSTAMWLREIALQIAEVRESFSGGEQVFNFHIITGLGDKQFEELKQLIKTQGAEIMAKFEEVEQELKDTKAAVDQIPQVIASESAEVASKIAALEKTIQELKDQIAAGSPVTQAQLDSLAKQASELKLGVAGIGPAVAAIFTDTTGPTP